MPEMTKVDTYMAYLNRILAGKLNIRPVEDEEIEELLLMAKAMIKADFSSNSKIRENLKKQLLAQLTKKDKPSPAVLLKYKEELDTTELDDEELDYVVAAFAGQGELRDTCPFCGSRTTRIQEKCPFCHR